MATDKFNRNYYLIVQTQQMTPLTISLPITVEFDLTRNILNSANVASIRIYNLNPQTRDSIGFNIYAQNQDPPRTVQLLAGYGNNLSTIFSGNITQCWSVREGTNYITQIESFDGGFVYNTNTCNLSFPKNTPNATVISSLIANLGPTIVPGTVAPIPGITPRGKSYSGITTQILGELTNGGFFIDNGKANVLGNQQTLQGGIALLTNNSGLIGTPVREQNIITFDMIFEPRVQAGQFITLNLGSTSGLGLGTNFNNNYKLSSVKHRGMISGAVCGDCITTMSMIFPALPSAASTEPDEVNS